MPIKMPSPFGGLFHWSEEVMTYLALQNIKTVVMVEYNGDNILAHLHPQALLSKSLKCKVVCIDRFQTHPFLDMDENEFRYCNASVRSANFCDARQINKEIVFDDGNGYNGGGRASDRIDWSAGGWGSDENSSSISDNTSGGIEWNAGR
jgi:hypothetical protein